MIRNLGAALSIVATAEAMEELRHMDVSAWGAPSECHDLVRRGEEARLSCAIREAEAIAGQPWDVIAAEAEARGLPVVGPLWADTVGRIIHRYNPFA